MKYLISFLFLALAFSMKSEAKVTLPSILGDNMVLQQQAEVKLWGKARPNATVTDEDRKAKAVADYKAHLSRVIAIKTMVKNDLLTEGY